MFESRLSTMLSLILQRLADRQPGLATHHDGVTSRRLTKKLHVGRIVPGKFAAFSDCILPIDCCDADDHVFLNRDGRSNLSV